MIQLKRYVNDSDQIDKVLDENEQLILIFGKSINTARNKIPKGRLVRYWVFKISISNLQYPIKKPDPHRESGFKCARRDSNPKPSDP